MLCSMCGKKAATTHIKSTVNGVTEQHYLCPDCARAYSANNPLSLGSLIGSFFGDTLKTQAIADNRKRCSGCGVCFDDIASSGKVGCDRCYETFLDQLLPSLQRMHGRSRHAGKTPAGIPDEDTAQTKLEALKAQLKLAIDEQNFEQAATLRDQIKELESEVENDE